MDELISRQAVKDLIMETDPWWWEGMTRAIFEGVKKLPIVDAVPVVRCKDCKWWKLSEYNTCGIYICKKFSGVRVESDFCSRGERREE